MNCIPCTIAIGGIVGSLVGLTGLGGGVLLLPFLVFGLQVPPLIAVGSGAVFATLTKISAAGLHWRQGSVDTGLTWNLASGSVPGALIGVGILAYLRFHYGEAANDILSTLIGILLVMIPLLMGLQYFWEKQNGILAADQLPNWGTSTQRESLIGLTGGFLVGLTSIGAGSVIMLLLLLFCRRNPVVLVGTDIFHAVILTGVTGLAHIGLGTVDVELVGWLLLGSVPGVVLGSRLTILVPTTMLRLVLLVLIFTSGLSML